MSDNSYGPNDDVNPCGAILVPQMTVQEAGRRGGEKVRDERGSEFYSAIGSKGGNAVKATRGVEFYREIGRKGGKAAMDKHGTAHFQAMGTKGGNATKAKNLAKDPDYYKKIGAKGGRRVRELIEAGRAAVAAGNVSDDE